LTVHGEPGGVLRIEEVTRRVQLETQMIQAQKLEAIGTLAGGIAHDFNNILSAIAGHAELALEQATSPTLREDVQAIRDAARRATDLTRQILAFSHQGHQEARLVQPAAVVREALKLLRASIPATVEIHAHLDCQATVLADPTELHRVVVNLCTNAAQAMKEGGRLELALEEVAGVVPFTASHQSIRPGGSVRLTVRDTGVGMLPGVKARIFEPFFTTRHGEGGTGMGLAMVHGIVQRLGGTISVASEPGAGTTFQIVLPMRPADTGTPRGEETAGLPGTERVLFLDDEVAICRVAERSLGRLGYRVTAFSAPQEALAAFEARPDAFDVVVTDMTMPGLTGELVARRIKARRPGIPVVLCTGYSERAAKEGAVKLGIDQLVMKPMAGAQLSRVIRAVLERR
jgi:nitrogen-specific signal transduction histidine kinase/ActR/RegA family two-component response regulator